MTRKIQREEENPIDNILYDICEKISPTFYKLGFTPNSITLLSFLTTLASLNYFNQTKNYLGCLFLILSYFFDCLDGHFARKYNMISKFGDLLDHGTDLFLTIGLIYMLHHKNSFDMFKKKIMILLGFGLISIIHLGCQEKIYDQDHSPTLSFTKLLVPNKTKCQEYIKYTRYFGMGSSILLICGLFLF